MPTKTDKRVNDLHHPVTWHGRHSCDNVLMPHDSMARSCGVRTTDATSTYKMEGSGGGIKQRRSGEGKGERGKGDQG